MENDIDRTVPVQDFVGSRLTNGELVDAIEKADAHFSHSGTEEGKLWLCHLDALLKIQLERAANAPAEERRSRSLQPDVGNSGTEDGQ